MQRICEIWLTVVRNVYRLAKTVERYDKDLARQMRRAVASGALNFQEGVGGRGGTRIARFHDAMGSARETRSCLHVCEAAGFVTQEQIAEDLDRIDHFVAMTYRLTHPRR